MIQLIYSGYYGRADGMCPIPYCVSERRVLSFIRYEIYTTPHLIRLRISFYFRELPPLMMLGCLCSKIRIQECALRLSKHVVSVMLIANTHLHTKRDSVERCCCCCCRCRSSFLLWTTSICYRARRSRHWTCSNVTKGFCMCIVPRL